jgi:hypothetical protein
MAFSSGDINPANALSSCRDWTSLKWHGGQLTHIPQSHGSQLVPLHLESRERTENYKQRMGFSNADLELAGSMRVPLVEGKSATVGK